MSTFLENSSSTALDLTEPHSLDGYLVVKENVFKPEPQNLKIRPNIHVCWNVNENKFCITFNEHSRVKSDTQQRCSFTGSFGLDDLKNVRSQFSYLCGSEVDERYFPSAALSDTMQLSGNNFSSSSSWLDYFFRSSKNLSPEIMDKLSIPLEDYLSEIYRRSSHFTFLSILYPEDFDFEQYFENLSELRHKNYLERTDKAKRNLESLSKSRDEQKRTSTTTRQSKLSAINNKPRRNSNDKSAALVEAMISTTIEPRSSNFESTAAAAADLGSTFCEQFRQGVWDLLETTGEYFTYLKQPFLDMRELAAEKIRHAKSALKSADYGDRVKSKLKERLPHWQREHANSVENLRDLQLQYFDESRRILQQYRDALFKETRPPHRSTYFTTLSFKEQFLDAERRLAFENVNYWTTVIQNFKSERKQVLAQVAQIDPASSNFDESVRRSEEALFRVQTKYLEANVQLLQEKDQYLKLQLREIRQKAVLTPENGEQDGEDVFYDAVESELELQRFLEMYSSSQPKILAFKTELEAVHRQKAALRNKKKKLESLKRDGNLLTSMATSEQLPELRQVIEIEQQRKAQLRDDRVRQQRVQTLQRIRDYRTKNATMSRTNSKRSLSTSTISTIGVASSSTVRPAPKKKSPTPAAIERKTTPKIRNESATKKNDASKDDLWSVPDSTAEPTDAVPGNNGSKIPPAPPPPPPPMPTPTPTSSAAIPPPPPLMPTFSTVPPAPIVVQAPKAFFVPFGDGPAASKKPAPFNNSPMDSVFHAIKNGVQLKRVDANEEQERKRKPMPISSKGGRGGGDADVHSQLLKELMNRMNKVAMVSSSESESDDETASFRNGGVDDGDDEFDD